MYGDWNGNGHAHGIGGWKADVRDYARWEYGTEDAAQWLLRQARVGPRRKRTPLFARIRRLLRPAVELPAATAVAVIENRSR